MSENFDAPAEIKALGTEIKTALDRVRNVAEDALREAKGASGEVKSSVKAAADEALASMGARVAELEQKAARRGKADDAEVKSVGQRFVDDDGYKAIGGNASWRGRHAVEVKNITSATAAGVVRADRSPEFVMLPNRRMTIRDLLTPGTTSSNAVEFVREATFTNAAAPVAEAGAKPQSAMTTALTTVNVRTIAHWMRASRQVLADAPQLQSIIDGRLRFGLAFAEEMQLLAGDGTGQNINGLIPQATAYSAPFALAGATAIDTIRLALLQASLAEFPSTGIVMHPTDWARIETTKDTQGRYIIGNPQQGTQPTLWGLPVVATQAITVDKVLVGAFRLGAQIFDREDAVVMVSTEDQDNFTKNLVTVLAEERLALAVYRPAAFVYADLGFVA
jgi:HK97 family phage major capsid protein